MNQRNVEFYKTPWGEEPYCKKCGSDIFWQDCDQCEEGYSYHDCGEDTCCCLDPQPNVICDVCNGKSGWYVCFSCDFPKPQDPKQHQLDEVTKIE